MYVVSNIDKRGSVGCYFLYVSSSRESPCRNSTITDCHIGLQSQHIDFALEKKMKEKPIIFSTPMVKALLNTKPNTWPAEPIDPKEPFKSMTRRVVIPQPNALATSEQLIFENGVLKRIWRGVMSIWQSKTEKKPKYNIGDLLWVRETSQEKPAQNKDCGYCRICKKFKGKYIYRASFFHHGQEHSPCHYWKPSIHMPRAAARLFLEVKSVRVERLQDISEKDAEAEGVGKLPSWAECGTFRRGYEALWNKLNAKRGYSWESNPWVWVYEFMRREANNG